MATIPKNSKRIAELESTITKCTVYTLDNYFRGKDVEPRWAWKALRDGLRTKLTDNGSGTYTVHVHSNCWYELRQASETQP